MSANNKEFKFFSLWQDTNKSIPQYLEYTNSLGYITYGENNLYPEYIKSLMNKSAKHSAIVKTKAGLIGGNGFAKNNINNDTLKFIANPYGKEDLESILSKVSYDYELYGGYALNITWSKDRSQIACINYIDPAKLRIMPNTKGGADKYLISDNWANTTKYKPVLYDGFSKADRKSANQILYVKEYRPGVEWYAQPEYLSVVNWIELEWEISLYHLSGVKNGFNPPLVINFAQGVPSDEEMDMMITKLRKEYEGSINNGKALFTFSDGKDNAPIITRINPDASDDRFIQLNKEVTEGIMVGHRVTNTSIFGIKTPGELGNTNDYIDALKIFQGMYVTPKQTIIEREFNSLAAINNVPDKLLINKHKIDVEVKVNAVDLVNVLSASVNDEQKVQVFIALGYQEDVARKLVATNQKTN